MRKLTVALIGNPNCGKSTLFNALTGSQQQIGNWPGVTVERKSGYFVVGDCQVELIDLPGIYSLITTQHEQAIDAQIACEYLLEDRPDIIVNVIDATHLERNLYLSLQLLELGIPMIMAVNMLDIAQKQQLRLDMEQLAREVDCPVIALQSRKRQGIDELKRAIVKSELVPSKVNFYSATLQDSIVELAKALHLQEGKFNLAARLLENDSLTLRQLPEEQMSLVTAQRQKLEQVLGEDSDIIFADVRYSFIHGLIEKISSKSDKSAYRISAWVDNIVLNRWLGIPIFLFTMYAMFFFAINLGGVFQDFFDISTNTILVDGLADVLLRWHWPSWSIAIIAGGVGKGINTTLTFVPVIGAMFLFLAFLEASGYMARAAFVMDRAMRALGLSGKSFVPMIIGFGCNVPAVMAARTLENKRDRVLTILMTPFMSCGARMAIFAVFTTAFFPVNGQNIVFSLYMLGIFMAVMTGLILRKTVLQGEVAPLILELPPYHLPSLRLILRQTWQRLKGFIFKAGKLIVPFCMLLGMLSSLGTDGSLNLTDASSQSLLAKLGQWLTPIFTPMGIQADNWPATVGLLTGIFAKEVVIASLNTLYTQLGHFALAKGQVFDLWQGLNAAWRSIPENLAELGQAIQNPLLASVPEHAMQQSVYGEMYQRFGSPTAAFAYLVFVLLYLPCVSTVAVIARELSRGWAIFATIWSTLLAYGIAVGFYQLATLNQHPLSSLTWLFAILAVLTSFTLGLRLYGRQTPSIAMVGNLK